MASFMFKNAIVRPPTTNFAQGLTTAHLGPPDLERALGQHERYCEALEACGLTLTRLAADLHYPDATFVEDTALLTDHCAILTRPGAICREGEVASIKDALACFFSSFHEITPLGTLDGGDVSEAGNRFFIGISNRTNAEGARQLAGFLEKEGYGSAFIDIRGIPGILHLKSGLAWLGGRRLVLVDALAGHEAFREYDIVRVDPVENYAANCLRVNERVLLPAGYPGMLTALCNLGCAVITLDMSEFEKMDGGLSCLSLRF
jgi:dimethylargininase